MKFIEPLDDILSQKSKVRILRLLTLKGNSLSGRQISEGAGISPPTAHEALKELTESGILIKRTAGRASMFKLDEGNYLVKEIIIPFFKKESNLLNSVLADLFKKITVPVVSIILYGSLAQKKETVKSDIDLMVVAEPKHKKKLEELFDKICSDFSSKYRKTLSPNIITAKELQDKYKKRNLFIVEVIKTGVVLHGKLISGLLSHDRQKN